jgi:RecJ-like exonuclease
MKSNLFGVSIATIVEHDPNVECPSCEGAGQNGCEDCMGDSYVTCDECDGSGEVMCDECDGSGEDSEGNACDECQGSGQVSCHDCGGDGNIECNSCDSTGSVDCHNCDGNGDIATNDSIKLEYLFVLSWNSKFRDLFDSMEQPKVISWETVTKLSDNSQSLVYFTDEIVDEDDDNGLLELQDDTTVFITVDLEPVIELRDTSGVLTVRGLYV